MGKIERIINDEIKSGDLVRLIDGSALTDYNGQKMYIVKSYSEITRSSHKIEDMEFVVDEIGINDIICEDYLPLRSGNLYYVQDIVVTNGVCKLRTASGLVIKI